MNILRLISMRNFTKIAAHAVITVALFTVALITVNNMMAPVPDIMFSYSTGECAYVIIYTKEGPVESECPETLPKRYHRVWIQ